MTDSLVAASRPYPWPWHGRFQPSHTALLIVRDGEIAPPDPATEALLCSVAQLAANTGVVVVDLPGRESWRTWPALSPDLSVTRPHFGAFTGTDLDTILRRRRISDLVITGFPFELGADCTMRQANDLGYECLALTDCCSGMAPDTLRGAFASIQMSGGIFGVLAEAAAVLTLFSSFFSNASNPAHERAQGARQ